jgi:acetoin utilization deacetylase AcuC-like enzyme
VGCISRCASGLCAYSDPVIAIAWLLAVPWAPGCRLRQADRGRRIGGQRTLLGAGCLRAFHAVVPLLLAFRPRILVSQHGCDTHWLDSMADAG